MIRRLQPEGRLSGAAVHGGTVYLAGQVADDPSLDAEGQTRDILRQVDALLAEAGLPPGVLQLLDEGAGEAASRAGFDRIVLTGSAETGARVLAAAAEHLTPATMELSGADPVFVLPGADVDLVARSLAYGLRLNGGATCIAPRRVFVPHGTAAALEAALLPLLPAIPSAATPPAVAARLERLAAEAVAQGAVLTERPVAA